MLLKDKKTAIIGGGPVGLTMANLLSKQGADVTVYERDTNPEARIWGGTLDLHKSTGQKALQQAGLLEKYYELAIPMGRLMTDEQLNVLSLMPVTPENRFDNPEINRNNLRTMLLNGLDDKQVVWNRKCTEINARNDKWYIEFENEVPAEADLVIVANGGMSRVRRLVTDAETEDTGTFIIHGDVPEPEINCPEFYQLCNGNRLMTAEGGCLFVANPNNNDLLIYGIIFKTPEEWNGKTGLDFSDNESVRTFLAEKLADWHPLYRTLLQATTLFVGLPTRKLPIYTPWKSNRPLPVTLIGDAAHLMPPFAGQGVNIGMMDALILSENFKNPSFQSINEAILDYEKQMFSYALQAQAESAKNELDMRDPAFSFQQLFR